MRLNALSFIKSKSVCTYTNVFAHFPTHAKAQAIKKYILLNQSRSAKEKASSVMKIKCQDSLLRQTQLVDTIFVAAVLVPSFLGKVVTNLSTFVLRGVAASVGGV